MVAVGCQGPVADPLFEAHRGGAGYWPENSRAAVEGSIAADFDGIEVDLALTKGAGAVLNHQPWLDPTHCTLANGDPLLETVRIDELGLLPLQRQYLCGGLPSSDFPQAEVLAEPLLDFDAFLELLQEASAGMRIRLDLQVEPGWAPPAEDWLDPVLERWWEADLPQTLTISSSRSEVIHAFEDHARLSGRDLHTVLLFPLLPAGSNAGAVSLNNERDTLLGKVDYVDRIEQAGADGIRVNWEIAEKGQLLAVRRAGYEVSLGTLNDPDQIRRYAHWPVDVVVTDFPGIDP